MVCSVMRVLGPIHMFSEVYNALVHYINCRPIGKYQEFQDDHGSMLLPTFS